MKLVGSRYSYVTKLMSVHVFLYISYCFFGGKKEKNAVNNTINLKKN
jgi:hypothetical protein